MMPRKSVIFFITAGLALFMVGCGGQRSGGKGRTAQFNLGSDAPKQAKQPPKQAARRNSGNQLTSHEIDGNLSPEASVQRDLERLRQKEKEQIKNLKEMRDAMAQGSEIIRKEEERLVELRQQIDQFESAQRLYQQAAAGKRSGAEVRTASFDAAVPEGRYHTAPAAYSANTFTPPSFESQSPVNPAHRDYPDPRQLSNNNGYVQPQSQVEPNQQPRMPQPSMSEDEPDWNPPELFFPRPAASSVPPAAVAQRQEPVPSPSRESFPPPAQPRSQARQAQPQAQQMPMRPAGANTGINTIDDDIFMPDLFLSGGK